jgi:hypothetical protein
VAPLPLRRANVRSGADGVKRPLRRQPASQAAAPTHQAAALTHQAAAPTHQAAALTHQAAAPTHQAAALTHQAAALTPSVLRDGANTARTSYDAWR